MRSTSRGQLHSRSPSRGRARPSRGAARAPATSSPSAVATASRVAPRDQQPGLALVDDGAHARVVGGDRRQAARHRLDQDDPERLGRLGGQQEEVGGAQDVGQLGVGDRGRGSGRDRAIPALAARGAEARRAARRRRRRPGGRRGSSSRASAVDRDVEPLEVMGAVERRDERGDDRVAPGCPSRSRSSSMSPGENSVRVDAVRHLDQLRRVALAGRGAGRGPSRRGPRESTQTRSAARIRAGATECS